MKQLLLLSLKKKLLIGGAIVALSAGGVTAALNTPQSSGADTSPLVEQVQHNTDELANHEARISNTENDVKDLQDKTGTPPSTTRVEVPTVSTPAPTASVSETTTAPATPAPVVVKESNINVGGQYDGYCTLIYSDGTSTHVKATLTTIVNGAFSSVRDNCASFIGQTK